MNRLLYKLGLHTIVPNLHLVVTKAQYWEPVYLQLDEIDPVTYKQHYRIKSQGVFQIELYNSKDNS